MSHLYYMWVPGPNCPAGHVDLRTKVLRTGELIHTIPATFAGVDDQESTQYLGVYHAEGSEITRFTNLIHLPEELVPKDTACDLPHGMSLVATCTLQLGSEIPNFWNGLRHEFPTEDELRSRYYRLRTMAVDPSFQNQGVGREMLRLCCDLANGYLWANSQEKALLFLRKERICESR
eukprot:GHVH01000225.1.p1 GENE.GHVH01000225.1~~GHVH01000225.1.p1  ORF type:complete len:177 (+),score=14.18 GHVH01000225.1:84-614(+)